MDESPSGSPRASQYRSWIFPGGSLHGRWQYQHGESVCLIMALGIIVDDAIVVRRCLTHYQTSGLVDGDRRRRPTHAGAGVIPSLTTISLPSVIDGREASWAISSIAIPIVIICVIIASLIESFLVLPGHLRHSFTTVTTVPLRPFASDSTMGSTIFRDQRFRPLVETAMRPIAA